MSTLVFLLEEESAKNMLQGILPRLLPAEVHAQYILCNGKQDLERHLVRKIRYWREPDARFIILRDKDSGDYGVIKRRLLDLVRQSGKADACLVRLACHELESFFLGDLAAVARALHMPDLAKKQDKRTFRTPDALANAAEELKKITQGKYAKLAGSRAIGPHLTLDGSNRSHSFGVLLDAIRRQADSLRQHSIVPEEYTQHA